MQIAYLSTFYPFRGGIAQFNASLYRALQNQGHSVDAFTFTTQYPSILFPGETQFVKEGDVVDKIDAKRILNSVNPVSYFSAAKKIRKYKPDMLLMKYWMSFFGPSLGYVASKMHRNTKVISILDNVIPHERKIFDKAFTKYFLNKNHAFIAMSEKVKNDLLNFNKNAKVKIIQHPLYNHFGDIQDKTIARQKLGLHPDKKTLLFFGFIRDYKGLDLLINAFSKLDESYQLLIGGEIYGSFDKYQKLIDDNPRKKDIHSHIKYISDNEVGFYFAASDVCVLPYKSATQSGITGISYHFETPIISTNVGGLSEVIHHNKTGYLVEKTDENLIADSIMQYFKLENRNSFVENIKKLKQEMTWDNFAKAIVEF